MPRLYSSLVIASSSLALVGHVSAATTFLSPDQDIILPASNSSTNPLEWLGANSPYFAGPNINGVDNSVPENCYVDQVAYVVRHGSRYPDSGAYSGWVTLYEKIQAANFTSINELSFLHDWQTVLTNPTLQISQESPTGWKEAYDLGYRLRTKYPDLYTVGTPFISWANLYPRVVQTAQNFVRGFLGNTASTLGNVVTVNSTGSPLAFLDSLSPSDSCPAFVDGNGGTEATTWDSIYLPPITDRLNALITGNLNFTTSDVSSMPYLCGFESQITGTLSPWCSVFTDDELRSYEYRQDLRYYYGTGPGVDLASKMMLPFLNSLVGILAQGPGVNGTYANGTTFTLPNIITAFANDGQMTELNAATGVWDEQTPLPATEIPDDWIYIASHFVSMRGTVALERLNCAVAPPSKAKAKRDEPATTLTTTVTKTTCTSSTDPATTSVQASNCNHDNCLRQFLQSQALVSDFCATYTTAINTASTGLPAYVSQCSSSTSRISSACSCIVPSTVVVTSSGATNTASTTGAKTTSTLVTSNSNSLSTSSNGNSATGTSSSNSLSGSVSSTSNNTSISPTTVTTSTSSPSNDTSSSTASSSSGSGSTSSSSSTSSSTSSSASSTSTSVPSGNQTYIRILVNDAVYPVPTCQSGPGKSCLLSSYVTIVADRLAAAGNLHDRCNVTNPATPTTPKGASFFTDLADAWLANVEP